MDTKRYNGLDLIRGAAIVNMIIYHALWDLVYLCDVNIAWYDSLGAYAWQQAICWTFILVSGFSFCLGKKSLKRGLLVTLMGTTISVVTSVFIPEGKILFGILTLIGSCMIIFSFLDKLLKRSNPIVGLFISIIAFVLLKNINDGYIGFEKWNLIKLPDFLYANILSTYLGFPKSGFESSDYFSLFPWIFLFSAGYYLFKICKMKNWLRYFECSKIKWLEKMGKHSLAIYIFHQPIIYLFLSLF